MSLIININSLSYLYDYLDLGVHDFIVGTNQFSCRQALTVDYIELKEIKEKYPMIRLFVLVNALVEQKYLDDLKNHLDKLNECQIDGIIFQDFGVLQICNEKGYSFEKIYDPETLNTNHLTLSVLKEQGIDGAFLAREIPLKEKQMIGQNCKLKTMVQVHGVEYMAYSKRKLLSNYKEYTHLDFNVDKEAQIEIKANGVEDHCHIYEDQYGTHITSTNQMCALDVLNQFNDFDYLYIDGQYINETDLLEITHLYIQAIEAIKNQTYNKELYDIYVIADNCTDNTAKVAKEAGAIVYERFDSTKKTKGYALNWFLQQKIEEDAPYDAFFIFDADNIVDKNFIKNMNKKLCQGEDVVQGYRDIKNPTDSWITAGYAIFYWTLHRFYHLARYNIGLSPLLNGTGFMVRFDVVKPNGWDTQTLTEDIEFSLKRIIAGKRLGWATDAIVYDEQPVGFKQSWSQRSRWTVGHIQCMHKYTKDLAMAAKENKTLMNFDGLLYIIGSIPMFVITLILLLTNFAIYAGTGMSAAELIWNLVRYVVPTFFLPILTGILIMALDKRPIKQ